MPTLFPFYHQEFEQDVSPLADWEATKRSQHAEILKSFAEYRKSSGFDRQALRGMKIYNVVQTASPEDEVSRIFIGITRTIIDRGVEQMTEGEPDFDFEPRGPSDHKKTILWKNLLRGILSHSNYRAHQNLAFRDLFAMGSLVLEQFTDYPRRTILVPNEKAETGYDQVVVRDYRRPKVGVRHVNPLDCWRNPNVSAPTEVPSCVKREVMSWNQFAQDYGRAVGADGKPRYKNTMKITKGSHVCVFIFQDELGGEYCKYAIGFGNEQDGYANSPPGPEQIGFAIPLLYKPIKIHEVRDGKRVYRSDGLNVSGMCNLRWGTYFDAYDSRFRGTHSVYGMGLPQRLEAEDMVMQTIFNINLDNYRWSNSVVLSYDGGNYDEYLDVDANRLYGGMLIPGKVTPQPLGISRIGDYQGMVAMLEEGMVPATGINHKQLLGDTSKTAFEFAQRIRMANRSAEQRLRSLENELFKPIGELLIGAALSNLTVEDVENMTEEQVEDATRRIKKGEATAQDYEGLDSAEPKRKVRNYIRIEGMKLREDFTNSKRRRLDFDSTENTLVLEKGGPADVSFVPMVEEYVYPAEYAESGLLPDVLVDSKRMLGDMKAQDAQNYKLLTDYLIQLQTTGLIKNVDFDEITREFARFAGVNEDRVIRSEEKNKALAMIQEALAALEGQQSSPTSNAQLPEQPLGAPPVGGSSSLGTGPARPQNPFAASAQGTL